jgi:hypothetical protein
MLCLTVFCLYFIVLYNTTGMSHLKEGLGEVSVLRHRINNSQYFLLLSKITKRVNTLYKSTLKQQLVLEFFNFKSY